MHTITTGSPAETMRVGEILGGLLQPGDIITLNGDLGAGKTCLTAGIGRGLQTISRVKSPSFALINEYEGRIPLYHMDVYRLESESEVEDLGWEEYFYGSGATVVEWAAKLGPHLPPERLEIYIDKEAANEETRIIRLVPLGDRYRRLAGELMAHVRTGH